MPGLFPFLKESKYDWNFTSTCDGLVTRHHKNNVVHYSQGKMIGGSGNLGYVSYARGYPNDYNDWAKLTNDSSWCWESVLQLFRKNEKLVDKKILNSPEKHYYGTKGKIKIQKQYYTRNNDYFDAFKEMGYDYHLDINQDNRLGITSLMFNIGDGLRQSTALKFLRPIKNNPNLYVLINTLATKIIFDDKKNAIGVEVLTENNTKLTLKANKEVIVAAGTIKSPHLLMLSGIGPKYHLTYKGIKVIADLPVGKNLQDHLNSILVYKMTKSSLTTSVGDPHKYPYAILNGYIALNKSQCYPDYEIIGVHFGDSLTFLGICAFYFDYDDEFCNFLSKGLDNKEVFLVFITYFNPKSKGEILLSSTNPKDNPLIIPGYYTNEIDIENHANYLADFNRIINTKFFKSMNAELIDPNLEACAGLRRGTKEYWRCHAVGQSDTSNYLVGTCAMGKVLDTRFRVYGVKKLRVVDASIMPLNVRAFTNPTVMMIAQKASDMIIEDCN